MMVSSISAEVSQCAVEAINLLKPQLLATHEEKSSLTYNVMQAYQEVLASKIELTNFHASEEERWKTREHQLTQQLAEKIEVYSQLGFEGVMK